ncbi:NAD(P)H-dependent oxidoreductase [Marinomonas sp. PE14-40]|uniref:NAD(P)H-dependent oxidoreductase n=1 Tax=Marinomonas sp. PE14-40 TaxID=3060621 RepID=UPI003F66A2CC
MSNVLILNGNPKSSQKQKSLSHSLADTYEIEARETAQVRRFNLADMVFNPSLEQGYDEIQQLEPCIVEFQESLMWADHIVIVSSTWWGGLPAKMKGLIDRAFIPGVTFKFEGDDPNPVQLMKGKTARILLTMDMPEEFVEDQAAPVLGQLSKYTLEFCGVSPVRTSLFGSVIMSDDSQKAQWLAQVSDLGKKLI